MATERLGRQEIFEFLRPEQVDALSNAAEVWKLKAGDVVYKKGERADHFYIVVNGQVALRLPGKEGVSIPIDQLSGGAMFGSCISAAMDSYALTAQCTEDCEILKIGASSLKHLLDDDPRMGYAIQSKISEIYFGRYIETMKKLQSIVMNIPMESV
jgi:CRP-like cAMP-binding protein